MVFSRKTCIITITVYHSSTSVYFGHTINCIYGPDAEIARSFWSNSDTFRSWSNYNLVSLLPGRAFWSESKKSAKPLKCGALKSQIDDKTPAVSIDSKPTNTKVMGNLNTSLDIELKRFVCGKTAGCRTCSYS